MENNLVKVSTTDLEVGCISTQLTVISGLSGSQGMDGYKDPVHATKGQAFYY